MRFFVPFFALSAIVGVVSRPLSRQVDDSQADTVVAQATQNTVALSDELQRIIGLIKSDPLLQLKPATYDFPTEFDNAFSKAISGITSLPTLTADPASGNIPQYAAEHFGPLVNTLEVVFLTLLDLEFLSQKIVGDQRYTDLTSGNDHAIYVYVSEVNSKFQGVTCQLAKQVGLDNPLGQSLKVASEQLFYLLFDAISKGQC